MITLRVDMARLSVAVSLALLALFGGRALMGLDWFTTCAFAGTILAWVGFVLALYPGDLTPVLATHIPSRLRQWSVQTGHKIEPWLAQGLEGVTSLSTMSALLLATWTATLRSRAPRSLSRA